MLAADTSEDKGPGVRSTRVAAAMKTHLHAVGRSVSGRSAALGGLGSAGSSCRSPLCDEITN